MSKIFSISLLIFFAQLVSVQSDYFPNHIIFDGTKFCNNTCDIKCNPPAECYVDHKGAICDCKDETKYYHDGKCIFKCDYEKCGDNTECVYNKVFQRPDCKCLEGFAGDPKKGCTNNDCEVKNPCGENAECFISKGQVNCKCHDGFIGYPLEKCWKAGEDVCDPNPCGKNAGCVRGTVPKCYCLEGFKGFPPNCNKECDHDTDCQKDEFCKCIEYSELFCAYYNIKQCVKDCRQPIQGKCEVKCKTDDDCEENEYCENVCKSRVQPSLYCGLKSMQYKDKVVKSDICICEDGFVPEPNHGCRKIRPNEKISCKDESCKSDCHKYCAENAECIVRDGKIGCFCKNNYFVNPFLLCKPEDHQPCYLLSYIRGAKPCTTASLHPECAVQISPSCIANLCSG